METEFTECSGMDVQVGSTAQQLGEFLGEGAEGAVYRLRETDGHVAKIFKADKREGKADKLEQMVGESMTSPSNQTDTLWTTWPEALVTRSDEDTVLGYTMPYLDTDRYVDAQRYASENLRWNQSTRRERIKPALNLVLTVHWLHSNGYAIGDLSEQNIRVNDGIVTLIDCDSYSVKGSEFAGNMEALRYTPPEGRGTNHQEVLQTDLFGVTVHVFQFLMAGLHPFQAVGVDAVDGSLPEAIQNGDFPYGQANTGQLEPPPPAPNYSRLPEEVRTGFRKCFSSGLHDPQVRPSLQQWLAVLSRTGGFDIDGVDTNGTVFESTEPQRSNRDWQGDIREDSTEASSSATGNPGRAPKNGGQQTATTNDARGRQSATRQSDDIHWADDIRGDTRAEGDADASQGVPSQPAAGGNKQSANQQTQRSSSPDQSGTDWALIVSVLLTILIIVFFVFGLL